MIPAEDLRNIYTLDDGIASAATWSEATDAIVVFFNQPHVGLGLGTAIVSTTGPIARAIAEDLPGVAVGQTLTVDGTTYTIRDVQPNGRGEVILELEAP